MTEGRNPQMTRTGTDRPAPADASGWGATTNTSATGDIAAPTGASAKLSKLAGGGKNATPPGGAARSKSAPTKARQPRRARLTLSHVNVFSIFKFSCVLAIALFFVWLIVVGVLYGILDVSGALNKVNSTVQTINGGNSKPVVSGSVVFGAAIIIGAAYIVLFIALATIGAAIYNLCADLVGGAELTLSERE